MTLRMLSLFSGVGGLDLAARWAGIETVAFVEIEPFCQQVLARHWPGVPIFDDVRNVTAESLCGAGIDGIDIIAGGFPCQPVSHNGHQQVELDERWLWPHFARIIRSLRPRYVLLENVTGLLNRGFGDVLSDLASCGYDAEWEVLPASAFGAPQPRERVFLLAYPDSLRREAGQGIFAEGFGGGLRQEGWRGVSRRGASGRVWLYPDGEIYGMADGLSVELDSLRALGNAVVPQVAYPIFEAIARLDMEAAA